MSHTDLALITGGILAVLTTGCTANSNFAQQLKDTLEKNPEIVFQVIEKNPEKFMESVQKASQDARKVAQAKAEDEEKKRQEDEFKNPKKPEISDKRATLGPNDAPVTIVMYSDFQCPYCSRGHQTLTEVLAKYKEKIRFVYKHLPLEFHPMAMPAAKRFEAIAMQSPEKAYKYNNSVYKNQEKLGAGGEKFLDGVAKEVGANVAKMKKDMDSDAVKGIIEADMKEAQAFGFSGTPGFLVNGVGLRGAVPMNMFEPLVERGLRDLAGK